MERVYFGINESGARTANDLMSFREYKTGSRTAEYRAMVDEAYELGEKVIKARPSEEERVAKLCERYSRRLAQNINQDIHIGTMCPSVMISGAGNFPTRKKERQVAAWERNHEDYKQVEAILRKIESIFYGKDVIKSDDENAIEKLEEKLEALKEDQEMMKAVNKAVKKNDVAQGDEDLKNMGYSESQIQKFREPDFCGRIGFPSYALQNNLANIKRIEGRISSLRKIKDAGTKEAENEFFKMVENTELMRLQLFFEGKPADEIREAVKKRGFKWSPKNGCWQRQLTDNAKRSVKWLIEDLKALEEPA